MLSLKKGKKLMANEWIVNSFSKPFKGLINTLGAKIFNGFEGVPMGCLD